MTVGSADAGVGGTMTRAPAAVVHLPLVLPAARRVRRGDGLCVVVCVRVVLLSFSAGVKETAKRSVCCVSSRGSREISVLCFLDWRRETDQNVVFPRRASRGG